jgi:cytidylate kinase
VKVNEQKLQENRLFDLYVDFAGVTQGEDTVQTAMFYAQSKIICDLAGKEPCVIVGRLANFILKDYPNCFNVLICADKSFRIERVISEYGIERDLAEKELLRVDKARADYCRHYTHREWGESKYYDFSINSSRLGIEDTADELYAIIQKIAN